MIRPAIGAQIAQTRPAGTSAVAGYTAPSQQAVEITSVFVANTTGSDVQMSLYHDNAGGSTFDQTTALYYTVTVPGNSSFTLSSESMGMGIVLSPSAQLGVQSSVSNALTFTIYGAVESRAPGGGI